jgi:hypothetical protein
VPFDAAMIAILLFVEEVWCALKRDEIKKSDGMMYQGNRSLMRNLTNTAENGSCSQQGF